MREIHTYQQDRSENETATTIYARQIERSDFRRHRAAAFTAAVMREIEDIIPDDVRRDVFYRLDDLFYKNGASIMTDEDRAKEGLEPRDAKGWTPSERVDYERRKMEAMQMMAAGIFNPNKQVLGEN